MMVWWWLNGVNREDALLFELDRNAFVRSDCPSIVFSLLMDTQKLRNVVLKRLQITMRIMSIPTKYIPATTLKSLSEPALGISGLCHRNLPRSRTEVTYFLAFAERDVYDGRRA
jgi:hypothetical protein